MAFKAYTRFSSLLVLKLKKIRTVEVTSDKDIISYQWSLRVNYDTSLQNFVKKTVTYKAKSHNKERQNLLTGRFLPELTLYMIQFIIAIIMFIMATIILIKLFITMLSLKHKILEKRNDYIP